MTTLLRWMVLSLVVMSSSGLAETCSVAPSIADGAPDRVVYSAYIIKVTPKEGTKFDWSSLLMSGVQALPGLDAFNKHGDRVTHLYVAHLTSTSAALLPSTIESIAGASISAPIALSALKGKPATYQTKQTIRYVKLKDIDQDGRVVGIEITDEPEVLGFRATSYVRPDGSRQETQINVYWQTVTQWKSFETASVAKDEQGRPAIKTMWTIPEESRAEAVGCLSLSLGDAVLLGGIPMSMSAPNEDSHPSQEFGLVVVRVH